MKNTKTPFDTKIAILKDINLDFSENDFDDYDKLAEFYENPENRDVFALATCIYIGQAIPTDKGVDIINKYFDLVCELLGITEDIELKYKDLFN